MRKYTKKLKQGLALLLALTFIVSSIPLSNVKAADLNPVETVSLTLSMTLGEGVTEDNYGFDYEIQKSDGVARGYITTGELTVSKSDTVIIKARTAGKVIYTNDEMMSATDQSLWEYGKVIYLSDGDQEFNFELRNPVDEEEIVPPEESPNPPEQAPNPPEVVNPETINLTITEGANLLEGYVLVDGQPVKDNQVTVGQATTHNIEFQVKFGSAVGQIFVNDVSYQITKLPMDKLQVTVPDATSYTIKLKEKQSDNLTIMWSYKEDDKGTDYYVENGKVELVSVVRNGETVYDNTTESGNITIDDQGGWVALKRGDDITIKLIPDYGYQVKSVVVNDVDTLQPQGSVSTFLLEDIQGNMHLKGMFVEQSDTINNSSDVFKTVIIENGENAVSSGNIELTMADTSSNLDVTEILKNNSAEAVGTVDITLDNVVSKGNGQSGEAGNWTTNITEFEKPIKVSLTLENASLAENEEYVVLREHDNEDPAVIEATFDPDTKEIQFETNKFSTYIIAKQSTVVHEHTYGSTYKYDATNHWLVCDDNNCLAEDKDNAVAHIYTDLGNGTYKCKTCGYSKTHEHEYYFSVYNYDETNHWLICQWESCPAADKGKKDEAVHVFEYIGNNDMDYGIYKCTVCGYTRSHIHAYSDSKKSYDETNHWFECTDPNCPAEDKGKIYVKAHSLINLDGIIYRCSSCAYEKDSHSGQPTTPQKVFDITNSKLLSNKNPIDVSISPGNKTLEELFKITSPDKDQGVNIWMSSEDITQTVSDTDKKLIDRKKGKGTVGMYLNLSLYKRVGTNTPSKVTELNGDLSITVDIPESLIKDNRTFSAIRVHEGIAEKLPMKIDPNKKTGTIQSSLFSTYAIVYEDTPASSGSGSSTGSTTENTNTNTTTTSSTSTSTPTKADDTLPDTGDSSNIILWASLTVVLAVVILIIKKKGLDTKQD